MSYPVVSQRESTGQYIASGSEVVGVLGVETIRLPLRDIGRYAVACQFGPKFGFGHARLSCEGLIR
jgi:hypothetical protein